MNLVNCDKARKTQVSGSGNHELGFGSVCKVCWLVNDLCWPSQREDQRSTGTPQVTLWVPYARWDQVGLLAASHVSGTQRQVRKSLGRTERLCRIDQLEEKLCGWESRLRLEHGSDVARMVLTRIWLMGLDSARIVHDEDVARSRRTVWPGLERLRTSTRN
jgi:hypothetical protein